MVSPKLMKIIFVVLLMINTQICYALKQPDISYKAYVSDSADRVVISSPAKIVDTSGIALVSPNLVKTWLDDVSYKLYVKDNLGNIYEVKNLISYSQRFNISILSLETGRKRLMETEKLTSKSPLNDYIISAINKYKQKLQKPVRVEDERTVKFESQTIEPKIQTPPLKESTVKKEPSEYKELARTFLKEKRLNDAEQSLQELLSIEKDDADAIIMLAQIYTATGRFEYAEGLYKRAYERTRSREIMKKLGFIYMILGQYKESIRQLRIYIYDHPLDADAHFTIAMSYLLAGDKDSAFNEYIKLKRINPSKAEELFDLLYR